jgi:hypothetical protein
MHNVISLFKIDLQWNLNLNMASKVFTLATKLCEAMEILSISCKIHQTHGGCLKMNYI